jgi:ATP adenylyltransferase
MNHLWSPWRMEYIQNSNKESGCIFCLRPTQADSPANLIAARGSRAYVILNRYPYTSGHLMVVPFDHQPSLEQLDPETRAEMMELATTAIQVLQAEYRPEGFNLGVNIGQAAGAGIAEHIHLHIVPRWAGDTNFMSSLSATRVLPEALDETYWRIRGRWEELIREG